MHFFELCGNTQALTCHISDSCTGIDNSIVAHNVRTETQEANASDMKSLNFWTPQKAQKKSQLMRWL